MSTRRTMPGGYADYRSLPRGAAGRCLCRWCAIEVHGRRRTFCSEDCVHEWRLRSDPGYLRAQVFARDRGVCRSCRVNTQVAQGILKRSRGATRLRLLRYWELVRYTGRSLWEADHIVPVVEGGGECDLSNLRTLCLRCHRMATLGLRLRREETRRLARMADRAPERPLAALSAEALS